ncbi:uncharacterized protein LOC143469825 [Clavelina lepadiformis]|uniref:uncharacterized protein LOC143469825 n=1 Tax=Clavelina lepadiformis TaxID=159417 RepID=UPI004042F4E2
MLVEEIISGNGQLLLDESKSQYDDQKKHESDEFSGTDSIVANSLGNLRRKEKKDSPSKNDITQNTHRNKKMEKAEVQRECGRFT